MALRAAASPGSAPRRAETPGNLREPALSFPSQAPPVKQQGGWGDRLWRLKDRAQPVMVFLEEGTMRAMKPGVRGSIEQPCCWRSQRPLALPAVWYYGPGGRFSPSLA
jgi:hypothetical protein